MIEIYLNFLIKVHKIYNNPYHNQFKPYINSNQDKINIGLKIHLKKIKFIKVLNIHHLN
jgi:hypothetical protein